MSSDDRPSALSLSLTPSLSISACNKFQVNSHDLIVQLWELQDRQSMQSQFAQSTLSPSQRWDLVNQAVQRKDHAEVLRCSPPPALGPL